MDIQNIDIFLSGQKGLIIHQIWFNLSFNSKKLFKKFEKYQTSWIVKNCNWRHMLWNEKTALEFMKYKQTKLRLISFFNNKLKINYKK